jgi:hypothetical protein
MKVFVLWILCFMFMPPGFAIAQGKPIEKIKVTCGKAVTIELPEFSGIINKQTQAVSKKDNVVDTAVSMRHELFSAALEKANEYAECDSSGCPEGQCCSRKRVQRYVYPTETPEGWELEINSHQDNGEIEEIWISSHTSGMPVATVSYARSLNFSYTIKGARIPFACGECQHENEPSKVIINRETF